MKIRILMAAVASLIIVTTANASDIMTAMQGGMYTVTEADLDLAVHIANDGDGEALSSMVTDGRVRFFEGGVRLFLTGVKEGDYCQFRIRGDTHLYWTQSVSIQSE